LDLGQPVIVCSVGAKVDVKDWGIPNWQRLFSCLSSRYPRHALALLGAADESAAAEATRQRWQGSSVNLCGALSPRESGAVLERAALFVGHDSGPMHLAASVGTPCVAIFSARNLPRVWFPYGSQHRVLYKAMPCGGCALDRCEERHKECIASISVPEVIDAIAATLPAAEQEQAFKKHDALGA
jgi:heptosyltransferase III